MIKKKRIARRTTARAVKKLVSPRQSETEAKPRRYGKAVKHKTGRTGSSNQPRADLRKRTPQTTKKRGSFSRKPAQYQKRRPFSGTQQPIRQKKVNIPPLKEGVLRIIPLGGVEEVGKNMTVIEYGSDIIVIDAGFQFEEETTPGVDYILPNTKYIEERKEKIRGVVITHGHLDHIGGIPYIMPRIGNPPIYTRNLTALMIKKRQEEFKHLPPLDINTIEPDDKIMLGKLRVKFFPVTHSIPDAMGVSIETPHGNIVISGDLRLDHVNGEPTKHEEQVWGEVGRENNLIFISDSTNAQNPGFSIPESEIIVNLENIIKDIPGRIIVGTFASQFARMIKLIQIAEKYNRKVIVEGRSMKTNIEIAKKAGLLKIKKGLIIPIEELKNYPPHKLFILATGAQGEEFAALMRIANKKHKFISFTPEDTVILSSSIVPGNEMAVQKLKDNLYRHDVHIIHYRISDIHASGHANIEELKWINEQVKARYFMPAYGYHSMLRIHAQAIAETGFPKKNIIVPDNGTIIELTEKGKGFVILKEKAPSSIMIVDGFSIGDIQNVVIRDRQILAQDGIFVVVATIDSTTRKLRKSPDIISRGFVYLKESQDLLHQSRGIIKKTVEDLAKGTNPIDFETIKSALTDDLSKFLFQKTAKRPIVIPVLLSV